jgi:pyridoxamine 5'-phosphate oxidase
MLELQSMRREYRRAELDESGVAANPFSQFEQWFSEAQNAQVPEPNTMVLATSGAENFPNIRAVLLKRFDERGFVFFTNYNSNKAHEIDQNPHVAAEFIWLELERQVRVRGRCEKVGSAESLAYFAKRSRDSRIGAWISDQSKVIGSRKLLLMQFEKMKAKFKDGDIPLPDFWGGYRIVPESVEFWQGRESRLHDRILYTHCNGTWTIERLAP